MDLSYMPIFGLHNMREEDAFFSKHPGDSIRIQSIEISHFKGVDFGKIELFPISKPCVHSEKSNILALYGQNGSGKTTIVEALYILKKILSGEHLPSNADSFLAQNSDFARMKTVFEYQQEDSAVIEYITYSFSLRRRTPKPPYETTGNVSCRDNLPFITDDSTQSVEIFDELLTVNKRDYNGKLVAKTKKLFDTTSSDKVLNASVISADYISDDDGELIHREISWAEERAECLYNGESLLFNPTEISWTSSVSFADEITFEHMVMPNRYAYIELLRSYAESFLYVAGANLFNAFSDDVSPIYFKDGIISTYSHSSSEISYTNVIKLVKTIVHFNLALSQIIPGLEVGIEFDEDDLISNPCGYQLLAKEIEECTQNMASGNNEEGLFDDVLFGIQNDAPVRISFFTKRGDVKIPLSDESEGIKRIIYALDLFVTAFNTPGVTVVIDEFDAGIFEFLLGEILQIFEESGKGQLIFTSHNLRPLEVLDRKAICFTTTNPENRYIRLKYIGQTNNLRDIYFRQILVGEQDEEIYKSAKRYKLIEAFERAGDE